MTNEELELFKALTPDMVISKYGQKLRDREIGFKQYAAILRLHKKLQEPQDEDIELESYDWSEKDVERIQGQFQKHFGQESL